MPLDDTENAGDRFWAAPGRRPLPVSSPVKSDANRNRLFGFDIAVPAEIQRSVARRQDARVALWRAETALLGLEKISNSIEVNPRRRSGVPVLKNTRFPIAKVLAELAANCTVADLARRFSLSEETIKDALEGLSLMLNKSFDL